MTNRKAVLEFLGSDERLLIEIATLFVNDYPKAVSAMEAAIAAGNANTLKLVAHRLRGSASVLMAATAAGMLGRLEVLGETYNFTHAAPLLEELKSELDRVAAVLRLWTQFDSAC
jgi:HPt (histidine-containing phosphotransfer) domain-containing protein